MTEEEYKILEKHLRELVTGNYHSIAQNTRHSDPDDGWKRCDKMWRVKIQKHFMDGLMSYDTLQSLLSDTEPKSPDHLPDDSDMLFHECPDCNTRCNCSDQPCSHCQSPDADGWIKCSERLPDNGTACLTYWEDGNTDALLCDFEMFANGEWENGESHDRTHWMKLPTPPKQ